MIHLNETLHAGALASAGKGSRTASGAYVVDRLMHQVHALSPAGASRYEFGSEELRQPGAIAADDHNRVYVVDNADNTIKVFRGGRYETVVGASGDPAGLGFRNISGLWASDGLLYVADSTGASVEILQVLTPCL